VLRAALVDAGGTLWPDSWPRRVWAVAATQRLRERLPMSDVQAERLLRELARRDPDSTPQLLRQDTHALIAAALAASGLSELAAADALEALDVPGAPLTRPFAGAEALLAELKQLGLRVVVVSNAFFRTRAGYRRDFEQLGVGGCIDDILSSVDTGVRKPNPEMFRLALDAARAPAKETVMIGDS
jgi:FMN phosphatase YigB (HAD superfamily)